MKELLKKAIKRNQETNERLSLALHKQKEFEAEKEENKINWIIENH
jgi:hypothetical protein